MTDIQHVYFPEYWPREDVAFREKYFPKSVERADAVIAISEFTRRSLIEQFQCPPEKVRTIYPGVDHDRISRILPQESWNRIKMEYRIPDRFLIYPAGTWPHKNHLRLIEAIRLQLDKGNRDIALILTGIRQFNHDRIIERIAELSLQARVLHLGHLPWDELAMLYQNAQGMIYPSLFEGFGLPIVEAMAAGCPVACSDRAAIPEIAGEAAYYFNPEDVDAISDAIERLWLDDKLRNDLIDRGRKRSRNFDWRTFAEKTIEVYESVAR